MRRSERLRAAAKSRIESTTTLASSAVTDQSQDIDSSDRSKKSSPDNAFRFLELPAELRNMIYSYATIGESRDISSFRSPAITHVSKQVRQESFEVLFTENSFHCYVGSDLKTPWHRRHINECHRFERSLEIYAGRVLVMRTEGRSLTAADGEIALFKDVTLHVLDTAVVDEVRSRQAEKRQTIPEGAVRLHLRIKTGKLEVAVEELRDHPRQRHLRYSRCSTCIEDRDVDRLVDRATRVARDLAARWGFKGFTLADIETVAWACRFARYHDPRVRDRVLKRSKERRRLELLKEQARTALLPAKPDPLQQRLQRERHIQAEKSRRLAIAMARGTTSGHECALERQRKKKVVETGNC